MMSAVTVWLRQVIAAAFFTAAVMALIPSGAVKRIAMLVCSALMLMTIFRPLTEREWEFGGAFSEIENEIRCAAADFKEQNLESWAGIIEEELASYIETRAAEAGISCAVDITLEINEDGVPLPVAAELTAAQRSETVHRCVREELGIAEENIRWRIS